MYFLKKAEEFGCHSGTAGAYEMRLRLKEIGINPFMLDSRKADQ